MKLLFIGLLFSVSLFATKTMKDRVELNCVSLDGGATVASCTVESQCGSTDIPDESWSDSWAYAVPGGDPQTDVDALMGAAVTAYKIEKTIP